MANKYIHHGATYNGDGTSSAAATSNGGTGAWNNINLLEGTAPAYGTLAAGDVVYIRSKDAAGADITRILAANTSLGSAAATDADQIAWVLDNGDVWPGISGTLKYQSTVSNRKVVLLARNILVSKEPNNLVIESTVDGVNAVFFENYGHLINPRIINTVKASSYSHALRLYAGSVLENPTIDWGNVGFATGAAVMTSYSTANAMRPVVINPQITVGGAASAFSGVFTCEVGSSAQGSLSVVGGSVSGPGIGDGAAVLGNQSNGAYSYDFSAVGFQFPRNMVLMRQELDGNYTVSAIGCDDGIGGVANHPWGLVTSRSDNNPPYLSALTPDGRPWSWRVYAGSASAAKQVRLPTLKMYVSDAAAKTITQQVLVADALAPTKKTLWATVEYTDAATGLTKHISTRDFSGATLDSSNAPWSATVWGMVSLVKRKLEITTPTAIKPNTPIIVTLWSTVRSPTANDIYFVDPDFGVN